jgi:predicted lipoprotein with Yx(FWY)xxD motif
MAPARLNCLRTPRGKGGRPHNNYQEEFMRILTGLSVALLALSAGGAFAAGPAMQADSSMGKIYTDAKGMTLYTFDKDEAGKSNCYDKCAVNWPPFLAAADAVPEGEWTIIERTDGTKQWAYEGKPLYLWIEDKAPGDVTGEGKGDGTWHVAKAAAM